MSPITATMHNGQLILNQPVDWPEGTLVELNPHTMSSVDEKITFAELESIRNAWGTEAFERPTQGIPES